VTAVFGTHKSALLRRSHYVLFMDYTYKTNYYGMPLKDIFGVTPINKTFLLDFKRGSIVEIPRASTKYASTSLLQEKGVHITSGGVH